MPCGGTADACGVDLYLDQQSIDTTTQAGHEKHKSSLNAYP